MSDILEYKTATDFEKHILWQYNNAPAINSLMQSKQDWYDVNHNNYWNDYINNVLNIATANDYGLSIWGAILQVPRTFIVNGNEETLDTEMYRNLIRARMLLLRTRATVPDINSFLKVIFGKYGTAYVLDNNDMTITYRFNFNLSPLQVAIMQTIDLLPRPAGVKMIIVSVGGKVFGFNVVKGQVADVADLPTTGIENGDIYKVTNDSDFYKWNEDDAQWELIDSTTFFKPFNQAPFASYIR